MADRIQVRRDTAANWATNDPVLESGELGYETDTKVFRIGDGTTKFTNLPGWRSDANTITDAERSKLAAIESGATGDLTAAEVKSLYESNSDTNAFTDAEKTKLGGIDKATAAQIRSSAADKYVTADGIASAAALVTLTDAGTIAVDWSAFLTGEVTLGGNRTLGNPTNGKPGTWRTIVVKQDGTGARTLSFGANYNFAGGSAPTLSTAGSAEDVLSILCVTASKFFVFSALDLS